MPLLAPRPSERGQYYDVEDDDDDEAWLEDYELVGANGELVGANGSSSEDEGLARGRLENRRKAIRRRKKGRRSRIGRPTEAAGFERIDNESSYGRFVETLQKNYSVKLYGMRGQVPRMPYLRLIWMRLLSVKQRAALRDLRVCKLISQKQWGTPFFSPLDDAHDPQDSVWVHQGARLLRPAPNHSWVEVVHCAANSSFRGKWFYAAAGSGVSINVGRTMVVPDAGHSIGNDARLWLDLLARSKFDSVQIMHQVSYSSEKRHEILMAGKESEVLDANSRGVKCGRYPRLFRCPKTHPVFPFLNNCRRTFTSSMRFSLLRHCSTPLARRDLKRQFHEKSAA